MNSTAPVEKMHTATLALSWVVGLAFLSMLILILGSLHWGASAGNPLPDGPVPVMHALAPLLVIAVVSLEAVAVILLLCGLVRWRIRFLCSGRCVLSVIGIAIIAAPIGFFFYAALVTAIAYP